MIAGWTSAFAVRGLPERDAATRAFTNSASVTGRETVSAAADFTGFSPHETSSPERRDRRKMWALTTVTHSQERRFEGLMEELREDSPIIGLPGRFSSEVPPIYQSEERPAWLNPRVRDAGKGRG